MFLSKVKILLSLFALSSVFIFPCNAESHVRFDKGRVSLLGKIIYSGCSIGTVNDYQSIEIGNLATGEIIYINGKQPSLMIRINGCSLKGNDKNKNNPYFRATIGKSSEDDFDILLVKGVKGNGLHIIDISKDYNYSKNYINSLGGKGGATLRFNMDYF